ncbi:MarR family winged helix-turn-helix transcriptional regulator [Paenibacillus dokdonensis]|uniref:MarR family winged helix-turn-helix transcriptional regulator n=1 Tax=Paenibacillus dokdonensis TaxID=2567944 RepID=A0ABU6GIG0_9BACL|nr:MarR family winged helix-turn-helix transcriptional regulator [Paenibacillus dokdonensis]MEC0238495.1 MarR family winged helix-turn-helix transcriptional regulator [Paenibacillus dokdonensis]
MNSETAQKLAMSIMGFTQDFKDLQGRGIDQVSSVILEYCSTHERVRPSDIAAMLKVNPSSITRRIQVMEEEGIIRLTKDSQDQRSVLVSITEKGENELEELIGRVSSIFANVTKEWAIDEIEAFTNAMDRFSSGLKDWMKEHPDTSKNTQRRTIRTSWKEQ